MAGTAITFILYLFSIYLADLSSPSVLYSQLMDAAIREAGDCNLSYAARAREENTLTVKEEDLLTDVMSWMESTLDGGDYNPYISARNFLLPVVYTSGQNIDAQLRLVNSTWGQTTEWVMAVGTKDSNITSRLKSRRHLLLADRCSDLGQFSSPTLGTDQLFCLLQTVHDAYIDKYQWFVFVHWSTYVAVNQLVKTLLQFDSSEVHYIGQPASYSLTEMTRLGLVRHEKVCRSDAGMVLSRAALKGIVPSLRGCKGNKLSKGLRGISSTGEVDLGRCFSRRLGITCSQSLMVSICP